MSVCTDRQTFLLHLELDSECQTIDLATCCNLIVSTKLVEVEKGKHEPMDDIYIYIYIYIFVLRQINTVILE